MGADFRDATSSLTQRQLQALMKPCPTIRHLLSTCLQQNFRDFSTLLGVVVDNGRLCWHASVAKISDGHALQLGSLSPRQQHEMEEVAREMLYKRDGKSSVGVGRHFLQKGIIGIVLVRQLSEAEKALLPRGWENEPTDLEIRRQP